MKSETVFSLVNQSYNFYEIDLTFGSHEHYPSGEYGINNGCPTTDTVENVIYRTTKWMYSHLRTFKFHLWDRVKDEDLREENGNYFSMA